MTSAGLQITPSVRCSEKTDKLCPRIVEGDSTRFVPNKSCRSEPAAGPMFQIVDSDPGEDLHACAPLSMPGYSLLWRGLPLHENTTVGWTPRISSTTPQPCHLTNFRANRYQKKILSR